MQTPARQRAEMLFAEYTRPVDHVDDTVEPAEDRPIARASGPRTLHLPSDAPPARTGRLAAKRPQDNQG